MSHRLRLSLATAILLSAAAGCTTVDRSVELVTIASTELDSSVSPEARRHVYVFMMHGLDARGVVEVRQHLHHLGYAQTYTGNTWNAGWFEKEMARLRQDDPQGRIVLIASGAAVRTLVHLGQAQIAAGSPIDMVLIAGDPPEVVETSVPMQILPGGVPAEITALLTAQMQQVAGRVPLQQTVTEGDDGPPPRASLGAEWDSLLPR